MDRHAAVRGGVWPWSGPPDPGVGVEVWSSPSPRSSLVIGLMKMPPCWRWRALRRRSTTRTAIEEASSARWRHLSQRTLSPGAGPTSAAGVRGQRWRCHQVWSTDWFHCREREGSETGPVCLWGLRCRPSPASRRYRDDGSEPPEAGDLEPLHTASTVVVAGRLLAFHGRSPRPAPGP